jgi:hypothetical protein
MPRIFGHDLLAFIAAAIAIYATGFVIYALLFSELWMTLNAYAPEDLAGHEWKMALSPVMPIVLVTGLAWLLQLARQSGFAAHLKLGAGVWLFFMVPVMMYGYVFGVKYPLGIWIMDSAHLLIATLAASALLAWRKAPKPS